MKILILGGTGMLGHQLVKSLSPLHEVKCTVRSSTDKMFSSLNTFFMVDPVNDRISLVGVIEQFKPDYIINCIGIIKQLGASKLHIPSIRTNSLFPHELSSLCETFRIKLIHISTDCVFDGVKGNYTEDDVSNATDLYGRTKYLGEVTTSENTLTLRTSIIGRELKTKCSLLEWVLSQTGTFSGYQNALYTGFTTRELAKIINMIIDKYPGTCGLYQVSSDVINKYDLCKLIVNRFNTGAVVEPNTEFVCDRSLDSTRFRTEFGYNPPTWEQMINEMDEPL